MKKLLIIMASAALLAACHSNPKSTGDAALQTIMTRTSIRAFDPSAPVSDETLELLLRAGMAAPSAVNRQPWAFVVVRERENLDRLQAAHPYARMLSTAQAAIIVCGDMSRALDGFAREYWVQDASAATENILLAAHALGLGAVWTGVYPNPNVQPAISEALGLPSHIIPLNVIPIGCPAENPAPKDKWKPEYVHFERW